MCKSWKTISDTLLFLRAVIVEKLGDFRLCRQSTESATRAVYVEASSREERTETYCSEPRTRPRDTRHYCVRKRQQDALFLDRHFLLFSRCNSPEGVHSQRSHCLSLDAHMALLYKLLYKYSSLVSSSSSGFRSIHLSPTPLSFG